jgi:hypothetical protein
MQLGRGRPVQQPKKFDLLVRSVPFAGATLLERIKPSKSITTDEPKALNPFQLWVGQTGSGKTNAMKYQIRQQREHNLGGLVMDAKEGDQSLCDFTIRLLAETGASPDDVFIFDPFHPYGSPQQDFLYDDQKDHISWFKVVEELVSMTVAIAHGRSNSGLLERGQSVARMMFASLMLGARPLGDALRFLTDGGFRTNVVKKADMLELELYWLGEHAYYKSLPRDVLESVRNKLEVLCIHPALKPCISSRDTNGEFAQLKDFMARGGWWVVPLSQNKLKPELRLTLGQLMHYKLKVAALQREEVTEKPFFCCWLDEYAQYRSSLTHDETLQLARSQNIGLVFLFQRLGGVISLEEFSALAGCAVKGAFNCDYSSMHTMIQEIFQPEGKSAKDWEGKTTYSIRDEIDNYVSLGMDQKPGESLVRVDPDRQAYFLNVELQKDPDPRFERAFREAVAKRWYRPWRKND